MKAALASVILVLAFAGGCRTRVIGGSVQTDTLGASFETRPDGTFAWRDSRDHSATTQPSIQASDSQAFKILPTKDGMFAGIDVSAAKKDFADRWALAGIMCLAAGACWFLKRPWIAALLLVGAIASILAPAVVAGALVVAAVLIVIHLYGHTIAQLVSGAQNAIDNVPPENADKIKGLMAQKHDESTKKIVAEVKPVK